MLQAKRRAAVTLSQEEEEILQRKKEAAGPKPSMGTKPKGAKKGGKKGGKTTFAGAQQTMGGMGDMFAGLE